MDYIYIYIYIKVFLRILLERETLQIYRKGCFWAQLRYDFSMSSFKSITNYIVWKTENTEFVSCSWYQCHCQCVNLYKLSMVYVSQPCWYCYSIYHTHHAHHTHFTHHRNWLWDRIQSIYSQSPRLTARSREVSKPRDSGLDFSNRKFDWHIGSGSACQISERYDHYKSDLAARSTCSNWR